MSGTLWCRVSAPLARAGINQLPHSGSIAQLVVNRQVSAHARSASVQRAPKRGAGRKRANLEPKDALPPEVKELWQRFVGPDGSRLTRPDAIYCFQHLDRDHILGWAPHRLKMPPCYEEYVMIKRQHPSKLIAMQVGDCFEFAGWDALLAMEALDIRCMGMRDKNLNGTTAADQSEEDVIVPRAGFPLRGSSRFQIARLCGAGHEVAIVLQQPVVDKHRVGRVDRYVAQICTPHSPYYDGGAPAASEEDVEEAPAWGLEPSVEIPGRWTIHMWQRETLTRTSMHVHSYEELIDHLEAARARPEWLSLPVYFHTASSAHEGALGRGGCRVPLDSLQAQERRAKEWLRSRFEGAPRIVHTTSAAGQQAPPQMWSAASFGDAGSPLFLHESTARALGIKPGATPDIVAETLGEGALKAHRRRVRGLLMRPPPREVAVEIAATVRALLEAHVVPRFLLHRNTSSVWAHMQACRASTAELQALLASATATSNALQQATSASIMDPLLKVASWSRGCKVPVTCSRLQAGCDRVIELLQPVLPQFEVASVDATQEVDQEVDRLQRELTQYGLSPEEYPLDLKSLGSFFIAWERRKVHDVIALQSLPDAQSCSQQLSQKRENLLRVIAHNVKSAGCGYELSKGDGQGSAVAELQSITNAKTSSKLIRIVTDPSRESLGLAGKWVKGSVCWGQQNSKDTLLPVFTEAGKNKKFWFSSDLITALEEYREVVQDMNENARRELQQVTAALYDGGENMATLLAAQEVNEWGHTLAQVAECATRRRWSLPQLTGPEGSLHLKGVWPYWLPRPQNDSSHSNMTADLRDTDGESFFNENDPLTPSEGFSAREAVANDLELGQRVMVLTGANMSGKSTLMRAVMATALLGSVGLPVPCMDATIPELKSFFYRCFDGDNPLAGLSGHAYECKQMKTLYEIVGPFNASEAKHLICVDELGKGTDDSSATALCCAALQKFDQSNIVGIFATHQHDMVDDRLRFLDEMQRAYCCHMEVVAGAAPDTPGRPSWLPCFRPTFRVLPGSNYDSLALQVAWQEGMPPDVVYEAKQLLDQLG